jgi:hypothetical protein
MRPQRMSRKLGAAPSPGDKSQGYQGNAPSMGLLTLLLEAGLPGAALVALAFMPGRKGGDFESHQHLS